LAGSYWYCAYLWWRRAGLEATKARTATLATFTRWLEGDPPSVDDPGASRMRVWMPMKLAALATGGVKLRSPPYIFIDGAWAEGRYAAEPPGDPDTVFERRWALTILEFAIGALREEFESRGESALFEELLAFSSCGSIGEEAYNDAASRTGRSTSALRKAVTGFRKRQRELLRALAADTVADAADLDSELSALLLACDLAGPEAAAAPAPTVFGRCATRASARRRDGQ
jgi:hypothetical protein